MMGTLCQDYSGVIIDQNASPTAWYPWRETYGGTEIFQTFRLPGNYERGTLVNELRIPDLSGFQVLVAIDSGSASVATLVYEFDYYWDGEWIKVASDIVVGAHTDGPGVWFDVIFPTSIPVIQPFLTIPWGFGILIPDPDSAGISAVAYVNPAPLSTTKAFQADGTTNLVAPSACLDFRILGLVADNGTDFLGNEYRSVVTQTNANNVQTTLGNNPVIGSGQSTYCMSPPFPSPFSVWSLYFDQRDSSGDPVVIDSVLVDPITPNMAFNMYYSNDDTGTSATMTETDWEQKLWSRIPQVFTCTHRQQYVLPTPVTAKYMKLEFVNPQAQSYDPGSFQLPVSYKKFPTWVANYFIAQLELPSFIASQVNVQYDALNFAYDYYLDDLDQLPAQPVAPPTSVTSTLSTYFNTNATSNIDSQTLAQVNLIMNQFQLPLGSIVDTDSTVGAIVNNLISNTYTGPPSIVEGGVETSPDLSLVSSLNRDSIVFEQSLPVMYFFLTCRHAYKELNATFDYNRAYTFGVNDVAFMRANYTVAADTPMYIENGGDSMNMAFSDFVLDTDDNWYVYGA